MEPLELREGAEGLVGGAETSCVFVGPTRHGPTTSSLAFAESRSRHVIPVSAQVLGKARHIGALLASSGE
jgi:hypothetical protein